MLSTPKKVLTAGALMALVAGLTSCSSSSEADSTDVTGKDVGAMEDYKAGDQFKATEALDFSILFSDHPNYPLKDDWLLWDELAERTNVTLDPTVVPMSDYEQKRSLIVGAGDAPMIIPKTYPGQEEAFVSSGAILPVSKYIDLMPNLSQKIEEWDLEANIEGLRQADGEFYVLPGVHENVWQDYTVAFRTDVMEDLGLEAPKDWDEFREVLVAIKAEYPDSYPLSDRFQAESLMNVMAMTYGVSAGWGWDAASWNEDEEKFEFTGTTDEYRDFVEYLAGLVEDGLIDPESFTQDDDSAIQKFVSGKSYAISTNAQSIVNDYRQPLTDTVPGATVAKIPLPAGPEGNVVSGTSRLENGIMINADAFESDNFTAMMQFIDWLWYSDEGMEFAKWGVDGTTYTKDADGKHILAADVDYVGLNPGAPKHLQKDFGFAGGVFAYGGTTDLLESTFSDEELAFQDIMKQKDIRPLAPPYPLEEAEREQATLLVTPLSDTAKQSTLQFILGNRDLSEWDAYVTELEGKGMSTYMELVNKAYDRYADSN
ncbi:extracellular solute-binding protein [Arthrobacter sp. ATA002]|uniref:ABC transporter substrate-binding protein n=1 Tax=Arthrobacter sp. ATA002 TaxID=2991715 RepID=UPI0022A7E8E2|nr:extracellular solute-binding protein [Arthrobacter sp. ATA002]WAP51516.1 extracellular solute-binding protein [Arthrobacter sp. ATA002]